MYLLGICLANGEYFCTFAGEKRLLMKKGLMMIAMVMLIVSGCGKKKAGAAEGDPVVLKYAKGFSVTQREDGVQLLTISDPQQDGEEQTESHFALVPRGQAVSDLPEGYTKVTVPIERCIVMTLPQLSGFVELKALDRISGINSARTLYNKEVKRRIKDGDIIQIGQEGNFDRELIIAAQPEMIFVSPSKRGGYDVLGDADVPLVPYLGYKEPTALGQAEWIKFVALFTGQTKEANDYFEALENRYMSLKQMVDTVSVRPVVMNGRMLEGIWCAEGGQSVQAQMMRDAGARYVLDDNQATSDIKMEFEEYYAKAAKADYWTILNAQEDFDYASMLAGDARYADFLAFQNRHVVYCNLKTSAYRELSPMHPDWLLSDFIFAFHPELMPADYEPKFYGEMKNEEFDTATEE